MTNTRNKNGWFDVDRKGLRALYADKPKSFVLRELIQNAWDEKGVSQVKVVVGLRRSHGGVEISVLDDAPEGFYELSHAYTLFADTRKRADPTKRGRFNLGEKQVLALCEYSRISTTTGTVHFNQDGTRKHGRKCMSNGSMVAMTIKMTEAERQEMLSTVKTFIPQDGIQTIISDEDYKGELQELQLTMPRLVGEFETALATEASGPDGIMHSTTRKTIVKVYQPRSGEKAMLFERGLPVCETDDRWHYDIQQRVPLSADRDTVKASFLRDLRAEVLNHLNDHLTDDEKAQSWVQSAIEDERVDPLVVKNVVIAQHGERVFVPNPSDPQANERAIKAGYHQISGRSYSAEAWENIRRAGDDVLPSSTTLMGRTQLVNGELVPKSEWTGDMRRLAALAWYVGKKTLGIGICVKFTRCPKADTRAQFGTDHVMSFNLSHMSEEWLRGDVTTDQLELIIHELGHFEGMGHFDVAYHETLCQVGARLALIGPKEIRETVRNEAAY